MRPADRPIRLGMMVMCLAWIFLVGQVPPVEAETGAAEVPASSPRMHYDIAAQPLNTALRDFALASGLQVSFHDDLANGLTSPGVKGSYTPDEALGKILTDTGLSFRYTSADTVTLERTETSSVSLIPIAVGAAGSAGVLVAADEVSSNGMTSQKPVKVPEILVKEVRERNEDTKSYVAQEEGTAMRTDTPIRAQRYVATSYNGSPFFFFGEPFTVLGTVAVRF